MRGVPRPRRAMAARAGRLDLDAEDRRRAVDDRGQLGLRVEVEPVRRPEAVAQRAADPAGAGRGADDRERLEAQAERPRRRALADHHVERVVLHRRVEDLLDRAVEAVDLVDEQDVALVERGEDRGEVARPLDGRSARCSGRSRRARGRRSSRGSSCRGRAGRTGGRGPPPLPCPWRPSGGPKVGLDLALADVLVERARSKGAFDDEVRLVLEDPPRGCARGRRPSPGV